MEHNGSRSVQGLREIMAVMAGIYAHSVLVNQFNQGELSWQSAAVVWWFFDWMIRMWMQRQQQAWIERDTQKYKITGCWGGLVTPEGKKEPSAVSVLNIHSSGNRLSVEGQTFDLHRDTNGQIQRDADGKVTLNPGGDWHSTQAAFSEKSLLYQYASFKENVSGMCIYTFTWPDSASPPRGYNGAFYDLGGKARTVRGARAGEPINLVNLTNTKLVAQQVFESLSGSAQ
jgi:hypothetical protein